MLRIFESEEIGRQPHGWNCERVFLEAGQYENVTIFQLRRIIRELSNEEKRTKPISIPLNALLAMFH